MAEDAEESAPLWWELRWYHDAKFENKLIEAIRAKDKPSTGAVYRIFLFVCGILLFLVGWIMWNIGLPAEGESPHFSLSYQYRIVDGSLLLFLRHNWSTSGSKRPFLIGESTITTGRLSRIRTMSTTTKSSGTSGWTKFDGSTTLPISLDIRFLRKNLVSKLKVLLFQKALPSTVILISL